MAKVKLIKTLIGSPMQHSGTTIEVSDAQAQRFIEAGIAIPIVSEKREKAIPKDVTEKRAVHSNKQSRRRTNKPK